MDSRIVILAGVVGLAALWLAYAGAAAWRLRRRALESLLKADEPSSAIVVEPPRVDGTLRRWLSLAGFRRADAPALFTVAVVASFIAGIVAALVVRAAVLPGMLQTLAEVPGGAGDALAAVLQAGPYIVGAVLTLGPILFVRARRRQRVREIEQDMPLTLELFATLAEAGLSFDAGLSRIIRTEHAARPLSAELRMFQRELQGGVPRLQALRQLAQRVDVTPLTVFVSAVAQAEQVGASIAETLRHQADELRQRRRERALLLAQSLPVKLVFPLVACFLPGIFLSTLGPVIYQMIQVADGVLRPVGR